MAERLVPDRSKAFSEDLHCVETFMVTVKVA